MTRWICAKFFQAFLENTCLLQLALKNNAPVFKMLNIKYTLLICNISTQFSCWYDG